MARTLVAEGIERRRHERLHKMIGLSYGICDDLTKATTDRQGTLVDIGGGGLRFLADNAVEVASQLLVVLEFPGWRDDSLQEWSHVPDSSEIGVLRVVGMVVRCMASSLEPEKFEIAICFCGRIKE